jgi:hypothetical protein
MANCFELQQLVEQVVTLEEIGNLKVLNCCIGVPGARDEQVDIVLNTLTYTKSTLTSNTHNHIRMTDGATNTFAYRLSYQTEMSCTREQPSRTAAPRKLPQVIHRWRLTKPFYARKLVMARNVTALRWHALYHIPCKT